MTTITATLYGRPKGGTQEITVSNIFAEDAEYLNKECVKVSMEDIGGCTAVYFDYGAKLPDGEPDELILIAPGDKSCFEIMADAVLIIKRRKK